MPVFCTCRDLRSASPMLWEMFVRHAKKCEACYKAHFPAVIQPDARVCWEGAQILSPARALSNETIRECAEHGVAAHAERLLESGAAETEPKLASEFDADVPF